MRKIKCTLQVNKLQSSLSKDNLSFENLDDILCIIHNYLIMDQRQHL